MLGKSKDQSQGNLFVPLLEDFIDMKHELVLLAKKIDWIKIEKELSVYYSNTGKPSKPIRLMVSALLLKRLYNLGDERFVKEWVMNPYMQYFSGEAYFKHNFPFDPSDLAHFRKRIGEEGVEKIFKHTVELHGEEVKGKQVISDTTVQENNITYPTDGKLYKKIIDRCNAIADEEEIKLRQSYLRVSKKLLRESYYNGGNRKRKKKAKKSQRKLKTLAGRQVRDLKRKLSPKVYEKYREELELFERVLNQKPKDKNKIYSLDKPYTACISKGKKHKKYEFGNKIGLIVDSKSLVILAVESYKGNPHDSKTIEPLIEQVERNFGYKPEEIIYDRGGRGKKEIRGVKILTPGKALKKDTAYEKRKKRKKFRRRAAIEPVIGHLKKDHRMGVNYLVGEQSPIINAMLSASAWNLKKLMKKLKDIFWTFFEFLFSFKNYSKNSFSIPLFSTL